MTKEELNGMSEIKRGIIAQLMMLTQIAQLTHETLPLAALLHGVIGAALLNKEAELGIEVMPFMLRTKEEAEALLKEITEEKESGVPTVTPASENVESDDFFDKNEIIH